MYSKKFINILTFILTIIIFSSINFFLCKNLKSEISVINEIMENNQERDISEEKNKLAVDIQNIKWQIEIPEISLTAPIAEGTETNILNEYVGHFEETQNLQGNVGLAAHNRGYPVNYFAKLKDLKVGDEIIYTFGEIIKIYTVTQNIQISDIDWSYLENTEENKLTLITCIENKPEYRRCVQAIEKQEIK